MSDAEMRPVEVFSPEDARLLNVHCREIACRMIAAAGARYYYKKLKQPHGNRLFWSMLVNSVDVTDNPRLLMRFHDAAIEMARVMALK